MIDITKTTNLVSNSGLLIDGVTETAKDEEKNKKKDFLVL